MADLDKVAGDEWCSLVQETGGLGTTFEARFAHLKQAGRFADRLTKVEAVLAEYFRGMTLPEAPTMYDHLVLGMRGQDTIATFNWDPFLLLTYQRHVHRFGRFRLPDLRFLHGSVLYATCKQHDVLGIAGMDCTHCGKRLRSVGPLYPEEKKDYVTNPLLKREWRTVQHRLRGAFHLTIFGYSGPETDAEARQILRWAWAPDDRMSGHLEVVDLTVQPELEERWRKFIPFSHLFANSKWEDCSIARWPRRTMEWKRNASLYGTPTEDLGPCPSGSLTEVQDWYCRISNFEQPPVDGTRDGIALAPYEDAT